MSGALGSLLWWVLSLAQLSLVWGVIWAGRSKWGGSGEV